MTNIGFYIVRDQRSEAAEYLACRLAEKAYMNDMSLYIHVASAKQADRLDEMLWSFRQGSFIPHAKSTDDDALAPIKIGCKEPETDADMLINLSEEVPEFFPHFPKMAEIVASDKKPEGRKRYAYYKDRGYPLQTHQV